MKALLITALATALLVFATSANAATTSVRIGNPVAAGKLLTALPSGAVEMRFAGTPAQVWAKTGVAPGFVSFAALGRCLTGRSPSLVTADPCTGSRNQQWRTDADGFVFNRGLGLALELSTAGVRLAPFTGLANQRWVQIPA